MKNKNINLVPIFLTFLFFVISLTLSAQKNGGIKGIVIDSMTNEGLIGANIIIKGTSIGTSTDLDGNYGINSITPGTYIFVTSYLGYDETETEVSIKSGETVEINFPLKYTTQEGPEIIVTAQAEAQMAAINRQLASRTIKNVVSAKKIQENPDANAAEAIGRLPGVSIVRSGGEGAKIVVRGLAPKFNKVSIEGVSMASTGADDRSIDLSMISPYMLEGIELSKAALPDQEADVIGGSVNFLLRVAPDHVTLDALAQTGYGGLRNQYGDYKFILGGSQRFFNKKLGVFAQLNTENRDRSSYGLDVSYTHTTSPDFQEDVDVSVDQIYKSDNQRIVNRLGGVVVMDYKLPSGKIKLTNFTSKINKNTVRRSEILRPLFVDHFYRYEDIETNLLVMNNSLRYDNNFGPFKLDIGISHAYSNSKSPKGILFQGTELSAFDLINEEGENLDITNSPSKVASFAKNNIDDAQVTKISNSTYKTNETGLSADVNLSYNINFTKQITANFKIGGKIKKLSKAYDKDADRIEVAWGAQGATIRNLIVQSFPEMADYVTANVSSLPYFLFVDKDFGTVDELGKNFTISNTPDADIVNKVIELAEGEYFKDYPASKRDDYNGEELYTAAYAMAEFKLGKSITFIPGFRVENNNTTYTGSRGSSGAKQWFEGYVQHDTTTTRANTFFLPMIHFKYKPVAWFDIRGAFTQTLARPSFNEIIPFWDRGQADVYWNNPFLEPSLATNYDIYASFYQNKLGLFTIGGFMKNIDNLIFSPGSASIVNPEEFGLPENSKGKTIFQKINNPRTARLVGLEVEWQTRFWYLPSFLKGMVFNINYTLTRSTVKYPRTIVEVTYLNQAPWIITENFDTFYEDRLVSQPNNILNATLGYDYKGMSARISMIYQDDIFAENNFWNRLRSVSERSFRFDFSIKQNLPFKGWETFLNLNNITSSISRTINTGTGYPRREQYYGNKIDLGVRFRIK